MLQRQKVLILKGFGFMKKILAIVGPTAVGKTALSIQLAQKLGGEIISGDSMQVYKGLDIGTAKVTKEEQKDIPHYLIDCRDISENYSVSDFQKEGRQKIDWILSKGKLPIVVGGTGLYIQALLHDYDLGGRISSENHKVREKWEKFCLEKGKHQLWLELQAKDPQRASEIHENNSRRVIRTLEIIDIQGKSSKDHTRQALFDYKLIGLTTERERLYQRINQRVDIMMKMGLLEEVSQLFSKQEASQAAQGIGYKELFPYLSGTKSLENCVDEIKKNSRRYAKRQLTWFRNRMSAEWWDVIEAPNSVVTIEQEINQWLKESE